MLILRRRPGTGILCILMMQFTVVDVTEEAVTLQKQMLSDRTIPPDPSGQINQAIHLKWGESLTWHEVTLTPLECQGRTIKFGITAPPTINVARAEAELEPSLSRFLHRLLPTKKVEI